MILRVFIRLAIEQLGRIEGLIENELAIFADDQVEIAARQVKGRGAIIHEQVLMHGHALPHQHGADGSGATDGTISSERHCCARFLLAHSIVAASPLCKSNRGCQPTSFLRRSISATNSGGSFGLPGSAPSWINSNRSS